MKYKVGDKVRVKAELRIMEKYGGWTFLSGMESCKDKILTINEVGPAAYKMKEDGTFWFPEIMIESAEESKPATKPKPIKEFHKIQFVTDKTRGFKSIYINGITIAIPIETIVGIAYKNPSDEYDEERGKSLAYYRMEGQ